MENCMKIRAYAKINLGLNVKSRREDGYHELEMIMAPVSFYDEIDICPAPQMQFTSNRDYINRNPHNSILKAVEVMRQKYDFKENFQINLRKNIPTQGGLAGGSADGAMVIRAIATILKLPMTLDDYREVCMAIGSDEFFCLIGRCARVSGTGDIVVPIKNTLKHLYILLVKPYRGVSTKESFRNLDLKTCAHPNIDLIQKAMEENNYDLLCRSIGNSLEASSFLLNPEIAKVKEKLLYYGMDAALMSGSGSTVFGLTQNEKRLEDIMYIMQKQHYYVRKVHITENPLFIQ